MEDNNKKSGRISISSKSAAIIGSVVVLGLVGAVGFSYYEVSKMREHLYAVREDYYSSTKEEESKKVDYELLSQKVESVRVIDDKASMLYSSEEPYVEQYKTIKARVLEVKVTNNTDWVYSYYSGSVGAVGEDGVIERGLMPHVDDDKNKNQAYGVELAPGGTTAVFIYITDTGKDIKKLYNVDQAAEIAI